MDGIKKHLYKFLMVAAAAVLVVFDQFTQLMAEKYLMGKAPFVLINGVFELNFIVNPGAAFGIFGGYRIMLITVTSVALAALLIALLTGRLGGQSNAVKIACTLILAGGAGNLIDRVFRHEVIDFFYFKAINFAIFNVADCYVVIGASLILFYYLFIYKESDKLPAHDNKDREGDTADGIADADSSAGESGGQA